MTHAVQITEPATFEREDCPSCGVVHFVPTDLQKRAKADGRKFYCPNGHSASYTGSTTDQLRQKLEAATAALAAETKRKEWAEQATKQQMERADKAEAVAKLLKRRVKNGVCPCCHRTVKQLAAHMKTKHPGYAPNG